MRQHSSPEAFFRPAGEAPRKGSFNKETSKKMSHDDFSGISRVPYASMLSVPPASRMPLDETKRVSKIRIVQITDRGNFQL